MSVVCFLAKLRNTCSSVVCEMEYSSSEDISARASSITLNSVLQGVEGDWTWKWM